eukprot:2467217-Rhodomonas_salina.1
MQQLTRAAKRALRRDQHTEQALLLIQVINEVHTICAVYDPTKGHASFSALVRLEAAAAAFENARTASYDATQDAEYVQQLNVQRQQWEHMRDDAALSLHRGAAYECRRVGMHSERERLLVVKNIFESRLAVADEHAWRSKIALLRMAYRALMLTYEHV